ADGALVLVAMQPIECVPAILEDVQCTRSERIVRPRRHAIAVGFEFRLPLDHLGRRGPGRPFALVGNQRAPAPGEALAADANAVAQRLAVVAYEIEEAVGGADDDGSGPFAGRVVDHLPPVLR